MVAENNDYILAKKIEKVKMSKVVAPYDMKLAAETIAADVFRKEVLRRFRHVMTVHYTQDIAGRIEVDRAADALAEHAIKGYASDCNGATGEYSVGYHKFTSGEYAG